MKELARIDDIVSSFEVLASGHGRQNVPKYRICGVLIQTLDRIGVVD